MTSLRFALIVTLVLGGCATARAAGNAAPGTQRSEASDTRLERQVFDLVNQYRAAHGLPALTLDARISREARRHSVEMAIGSTPFGHDGFPDRIAALRRIMSCGASAENVASSLGYGDPAPEVFRGWLASRGHRATIEGPYHVTGVGVARSTAGKVYFTQIFVDR